MVSFWATFNFLATFYDNIWSHWTQPMKSWLLPSSMNAECCAYKIWIDFILGCPSSFLFDFQIRFEEQKNDFFIWIISVGVSRVREWERDREIEWVVSQCWRWSVREWGMNWVYNLMGYQIGEDVHRYVCSGFSEWEWDRERESVCIKELMVQCRWEFNMGEWVREICR